MPVEQLRAKGWKFQYSPNTWYVEAVHPNGGRMSVCEMKGRFLDERNLLGEAIAKFLNGDKEDNAR